MAWKDKSSATFTGASGQMAVVAELLHRKCNAAVPHDDVGTDVFAFRDDRDEVARIQVKTAPGEPYGDGRGYRAKFVIPRIQLVQQDRPELFYALVVRLSSGWGSILVISRAKLRELVDNGMGSINTKSENIELYIRFRQEAAANGPTLRAHCGQFDVTEHIHAWESLPPLKPPVA